MPVTDQISDFLTRVRNAGKAGHKTVDSPLSNIRFHIAEILKDQGFITDVEKIDEGPQGTLRVTLRYFRRKPAIKKIVRVSKPGRRVYSTVDGLPRVYNGLGIAIVSTSQGVMTAKQARKYNIGGEVLCTVW
jgi:small subunit ribosomal protein S8